MRLKPTHSMNPHLGQLKPYKIPEGLVLIVDTREQVQLFTDPIPGLTIIHHVLKNGDYSIKGFEDVFSIERKMISDFYGYIGKERKKTTRKMERFRDIVRAGGFVGLAIECSEEEILYGYYMSQLSPETARQAINSFRVRYHVQVYYNKDRQYIQRFILDSAIKFYNISREVTP